MEIYLILAPFNVMSHYIYTDLISIFVKQDSLILDQIWSTLLHTTFKLLRWRRCKFSEDDVHCKLC